VSRTNHHRNQKTQHLGHDYGSRYNCNRKYSQSYGKYGRDLADSERRNEDKLIVREELDELADIDTVAQDYIYECESLGCEPNRATLYSLLEEKGDSHWPNKIDATPTGNDVEIRMSDKHDSDKLVDILNYIESSNLSVELFSSFIKEYAKCKDIDKAWSAALCEWDC